MISRTRNTRSENKTENRDRWLISYADLITLLLGLFIVMYAASDQERAKNIAASFSAQNTDGSGILPGNRSNETKEKFEKSLLENPLLIKKTKMRQTERGFTVSLSEAGFFAPGEAVVSKEAEEIIFNLAKSLNDSKTNIRVEGHTDSMPISNARYPSNWELSTARAASVLIKLTEAGIQPERLSAAGYGGFQPVASNETIEGRTQNRRVDVVILNR